MSATAQARRQQVVEGLVRAQLPADTRDRPLRPDDSLFERGLDSLGVAALLMEIEQTFGVHVPEPCLRAECFDSLAAIDGWLSTLVAGPCASS